MENQETDVVDIKQENFVDVPSGDMIASIEEIEKEDSKQAISENTCVSGDIYKESIDGDVLEVEVFGQSSAISRSTNDLEQILEAYEECRYQLEKEVDIKVLESNNMLFESFETANKYTKEMIREYDSRSYVGVETS